MEVAVEDTLVISFFIYSFLGYLAEVIYCSVPQHRFVNRGFLYGPYLPIYGFGSLIVTIILDPLSPWPVAVFLLAMVLTSCLEYFTSWLLEKIFSVKLWDYSSHRVNINGRVCLLNSTLFGLLGLFAEYIVQPGIDRLIAFLPDTLKHYAALLIVALVASDTVLSVVKMKAFKDAVVHLNELRLDAEERFKALQGEGKAELASELRTRLDAAMEKYKDGVRSTARHIILSNPTISSRNETVQKQLVILREWSRDRKALKKKFREERDAMDKARLEEIRNAGKDDRV